MRNPTRTPILLLSLLGSLACLVCLALLTIPAQAQVTNPQIIVVTSDPSGATPCTFPWHWNIANGNVWYPGQPSGGTCTWSQLANPSASTLNPTPSHPKGAQQQCPTAFPRL